MGDGVNIAARLEGICEPGGACLSDDAYRQVRDKLKEEFVDLGDKELKNIVRPVRVYSLQVGVTVRAKAANQTKPPEPKKRSALTLLAVGIAALLIVIAAG
jgi:adenylate cyclase